MKESLVYFPGVLRLAATEDEMRPLYKRCAGLDVHRDGVSACVRIRKGKNEVETIHREFPTFTENLVELGTWLREQKITQVAMESTGVYWMPVWNVLEAARFRLDLMLVNATHVRALPGRKTDQLDCERMAELLQYGLVRGSFVHHARFAIFGTWFDEGYNGAAMPSE